MHHANELLEHLFGDREVGDHAILHGTNGFDVARHAAKHLLGLATDSLNDFLAAGAAVMPNRDDGGFVEDDPLATDVNQRVGGTEVDRHVAGKVTTQESEHECSARKK